MEYLLVDGYNIINAWDDIFNLKRESLEECRCKLLDILSNYQGYKKLNIIVVFDAQFVKGGQEKQENFDNLSVVFTKENQTADNYIERYVYKLGSIHRISVATSDYLEQTIVLSYGGIRVPPGELKDEINRAGTDVKVDIAKHPKRANSIISHLKPDLLKKLEEIRRSKF